MKKKLLLILLVMAIAVPLAAYTARYTTFTNLKITDDSGLGLTYTFLVENSSNTREFSVTSAGAGYFAGALTTTGAITCNGDITGDGGDQFYGFGKQVEHKATHYTVLTTDAGKVFYVGTPIATSGSIQFTLPAASAGLYYTFVVATKVGSGKTIVKPQAADMILGETNALGDGISTIGIQHVITLLAVSSEHWMSISTEGTWDDSN